MIVSSIGFSELKYGLSIEANNITIAIFIKLFDIKMVASNLLGFSKSESILISIYHPFHYVCLIYLVKKSDLRARCKG
ncbi:MAG: hypothetical protein CM15mP109_05260 [Candidatus Dadabacteria bacterium]|nr:MAG: hypothetical protein CM15mP109_05260 [Candidatus Dadabacteria bacterium]